MLHSNVLVVFVVCLSIVILGLSFANATAPTQGSGASQLRAQEVLNLNPTLSGDGRFLAFESTFDLAAAGGNGFHALLANSSQSLPASSKWELHVR